MTSSTTSSTDDRFQLYPAIDLRDGQCVRLYQGDYEQQTTYGDDPVAQASAFVSEGAEVLHVVDLDAAKSGEPTNRPVIAAICEAVDVPVQVGGGVRTVKAAEALYQLGVDRVVIGTAAVENPDLVGELTAAGRRVVVGLDGRGDRVATHGWTTDSGQTLTELADRFADVGVHALVVTEIGRDGTLEGPDIDGLRRLLAHTSVPIVASGGVGKLDDIVALAKVRQTRAERAPHDGDTGQEVAVSRLHGVIVGRALYENQVTVSGSLAALAELDLDQKSSDR